MWKIFKDTEDWLKNVWDDVLSVFKGDGNTDIDSTLASSSSDSYITTITNETKLNYPSATEFPYLSGHDDSFSGSSTVAASHIASSTATPLTTKFRTTSEDSLVWHSTDTSSSPSTFSTLHSMSTPSDFSGSIAPTSTLAPTSTVIPHEPSGVNNNFKSVIIIFLIAFVVTILVYLLVTVEIRFFQFVFNIFKLLFMKRQGSFSDDSDMGLNSDTFNVGENIESHDQRHGLDKKSKLRILWYMFVHGESFDAARLRFVHWKFAQNGISPDGEPLDPKFVRYT